MKKCITCKSILDEIEFYKKQSECKTCFKSRRKKYYKENKEYVLSWNKKYKKRERVKVNKLARNYKRRLREQFLEMYGNKCACCGETLVEFLTVEHKLGQIGIKKKEIAYDAYRKAIQEYRPDIYEIRCWNCNMSKGRYGYCPHEKSL